MSELEKTRAKFEEHCHGGTKCDKPDAACSDCALEFMLSREQKLKAEAVKVVEGLKRIEIEAEFNETVGDSFSRFGYNKSVDNVNSLISAAIKKIEGL